MSYAQVTYLYCDGFDCLRSGQPFSNSPVPGETLTKQRLDAMRSGWRTTRSGGRDLCPVCVRRARGGSSGKVSHE